MGISLAMLFAPAIPGGGDRRTGRTLRAPEENMGIDDLRHFSAPRNQTALPDRRLVVSGYAHPIPALTACTRCGGITSSTFNN